MSERAQSPGDVVGFDPQPDPPGSIRVYVSRDIDFDLDKMNRVTANVLGRLGCEHCHSGFDLRFVHILDYVADPETLEVSEVIGEVRR
jgi:hypothetical protein